MNLIYKKIEELGKIVSGATPKTGVDKYWDGDIVWVTPRDLSNKDSSSIGESIRMITTEGLNSCSATLIPPNSVMFTSRAPIGKVIINSVEACTNQGFKSVVPNENVDYRYLFYLLKYFSPRIQSIGTGATFKEVSKKRFSEFEVPVPKTIEDQYRIASLLQHCEQLILWRKESIALLDKYVRSVFLEMFGDPATNPKKLPVRSLSSFFISKKDGTKTGPFGSALKRDEYVDVGVPVWNMDNISKRGKLKHNFKLYITEEKFDGLKKYATKPGDIIISRAGTVGKMAVVDDEFPKAIISTNLIRLRLNKNELLPAYFVALMTHAKGRVGRMKVGPDGAFTHMNSSILEKLEFPYPPIENQRKFAEIEESVSMVRADCQESLTSLQNLYHSYSQRAFRGELDLSKLEGFVAAVEPGSSNLPLHPRPRPEKEKEKQSQKQGTQALGNQAPATTTETAPTHGNLEALLTEYPAKASAFAQVIDRLGLGGLEYEELRDRLFEKLDEKDSPLKQYFTPPGLGLKLEGE